MKKTLWTRNTDMLTDLYNLDIWAYKGAQQLAQIEEHVVAIIRPNDGLEKVAWQGFMVKHTNSANHSAGSSMGKEADTMLGSDFDDWINVFLTTARSMGRI
jgi:hypothetical protein